MQLLFVLLALVGSSSALRLKEALDSEGQVALAARQNLHKDNFVDMLQHKYLETVKMAMLGGLNHGARLDKHFQTGEHDDECLTMDFERKNIQDICMVKWDGYERLSRVEHLYNLIREQNIPGDLMECGVWRGAMPVYMKALLRSHDDEERRVWVVDSFNGVPNAQRQMALNAGVVPEQQHKEDVEHWGGSITETDLQGNFVEKNFLTVEQQLVTDNFKRFNLLDEGVKILPGYFSDTLPHAESHGIKQLALLRVDGDLYSSTMDVLENLYDKVSPGGFIVFDDWKIEPSQRAIKDFFKQRDLDTNLIQQGPRLTPATYEQDAKNSEAWFQKPL